MRTDAQAEPQACRSGGAHSSEKTYKSPSGGGARAERGRGSSEGGGKRQSEVTSDKRPRLSNNHVAWRQREAVIIIQGAGTKADGFADTA